MTTIHTLKRNIGCIFISTMFAICLLFFVPASVCSQSVDFWVQTPSDWIEKTDRLGKELMKQVVAPDGTAFIEVYGTEGPNPGTRAIADGWESEARQRGADYVQTRLSDMSQQVDNREGILREYEGTYNGIPIRSFIQYAYGNSGAVVVVGVFVQHAAAKYRDLVFQCVTSLRFSPPRSMSGSTSAPASASGSPYDDSPYGTATKTDICADIAGEWKWFNGGTAVILADGTIQGTGHSWKCLDSSQRTFLISWSNGKWLDTLTLSQDGNRLDGKNQNGNRVWAERKTPTPSSPPSPKISTSMTLRNAILGKWKWFTGSTPEFRADGTIGGNADNRWELTDAGTRLFTLSWGKGKWIDTLTLSPDGKRLDGKNQYGSAVWGKRLSPLP